MKEPRRIVFILGNGFDLDLGLKTSYKDFWQSEFCPKDYPAPLIKHLNERWGDDLEKVRWYDLENELLAYYRKIKQLGDSYDLVTSAEHHFIKEVDPYSYTYDLPIEHQEVIRSLMEKKILILTTCGYQILHRDELVKSAVERDKKAFQLIKEGLCKYLNSIEKTNLKTNAAAMVLTAMFEAKENGHFVNIYSFNYTGSTDIDSRFRTIIHYTHGTSSSEKIIIGTKDSRSYDKNYDFLQKSFDPNFYPPALVPDLLEADDVVFFGHSIGENDRQYFKAFFKQQTDYTNPKRKTITFFTLNSDSELEIKRALQNMTDSNLSALCSLNKVRFFKTASIKESPEVFESFLSEFVSDGLFLHTMMAKLLSED